MSISFELSGIFSKNTKNITTTNANKDAGGGKKVIAQQILFNEIYIQKNNLPKQLRVNQKNFDY